MTRSYSYSFTDQYGFFIGRDCMSAVPWADKCLDTSVTGKAPTNLAGKIAVMLAYARGEQVMCLIKYCSSPKWKALNDPAWNWDAHDYCIAPPELQPAEYRPYEHEELAAMLCLGVKSNTGRAVHAIVGVRCNEVLVGGRWITSKELLDRYTRMDGTPLGVLVEGEGKGGE